MSSAQVSEETDHRIYRGLSLQEDTVPSAAEQQQRLQHIPPPPPWRTFGVSLDEWSQAATSPQIEEHDRTNADPRSLGFVASEKAKEIVNAALCVRRPILIEGKPGSGKTSLAYAVARELGLPGPYRWSIVSRTTLREGLYSYDAIGRLQAASLLRQEAGEGKAVKAPPVGDFLRLGPMGMAFYRSQPRRPAVLLIDEIDKSDIDMPNDLLHIFEEGFFEIPELTRLQSGTESVLPYRGRQQDSDEKLPIPDGCVHCREFPLVLMTSNEAREFPPAFLRRCLRLTLKQPENEEEFYKIMEKRFGVNALESMETDARELINAFLEKMQAKDKNVKLATDQLLNAVYLLLQGEDLTGKNRDLLETLFKPL